MTEHALAYRKHNHDHCVSRALAEAKAICRDQNARLTPVRERVLERIWQSHKPLGAYDILPMLAAEGHNAAPPTVYRALDFLLQYGLVHRIASLNAFIGCPHAGHHHQGTFLICRQCNNVLELSAVGVSQAIDSAARAEGFRPDELTLEVTGLCPECQGKTDND